MKYVITGAAGNISKPLAEQLLSAGHDVTIIGRNAENLNSLVALGATAAIGELEDETFLRSAFAGADAVYTMYPPQYAALELGAYEALAGKYVAAIKANEIRYVVNLSSVGAHMPEGCGPVTGLHLAEQVFDQLTGVNVLHLRPGYFYTNFYGNISMVRDMNIIGGNSGDGSAKILLTHPRDIAEAAADELLKLSFKDHSVRYVVSEETTQADVASALGSAVGKPDLPWVSFSDEQSYEGLSGAGLPPEMVKKFVEMGVAMRTGKMWEHFLQNHPNKFGKTSLTTFAKEFAAAYRAS